MGRHENEFEEGEQGWWERAWSPWSEDTMLKAKWESCARSWSDTTRDRALVITTSAACCEAKPVLSVAVRSTGGAYRSSRS
jgi:hypothetical protein